MKTILFTNVRDENHILEWAIHHYNLGFTHIHIFDHLSVKPVKDIIKDKLPNVTVERLNSKFANKSGLIVQSCKYSYKTDYDWMLYLDGDEFLILKEDENVESFLKKYENYEQVCINWLMFGSNNHNKIPSNSTMLESYTKCNSILDHHVKSFVKPKCIVGCGHPHVYNVKNPNLSVSTTYEISGSPFYTNSKGMEIDKVNSYIAHYYYQSYDTYVRRKVSRERDDLLNGKWPKTEIDKFHSIYNDIENTEPRDRYNQKNKDTILELYSNNDISFVPLHFKDDSNYFKQIKEEVKEEVINIKNNFSIINNKDNNRKNKYEDVDISESDMTLLNVNKNVYRVSKNSKNLARKAATTRF